MQLTPWRNLRCSREGCEHEQANTSGDSRTHPSTNCFFLLDKPWLTPNCSVLVWNTRPYTHDSATFVFAWCVSWHICEQALCGVYKKRLRTAGTLEKMYPLSPYFGSSGLTALYFGVLKCLKACLKRAWNKIGKIGTKTVVQARLLRKTVVQAFFQACLKG